MIFFQYYAQQQQQQLKQNTTGTSISQAATTTLSSYRSECELTGSYISLECPSPPGPPPQSFLDNSRKDPQVSTYFDTFLFHSLLLMLCV